MARSCKYSVDKLLFRRQFILGPCFIDDFSSWQKVRIADDLCLTAHPELSVHQVACRDKSITLLGFVLDPHIPEADNSEIMHNLLNKLCSLKNLDDFFECTFSLGGRWILIISDGKHVKLFNDPMGCRQVFYTNQFYSGNRWCASQPAILAEILNLKVDKQIWTDFMDTDFYKNWEEVFWPGYSTPYREITHLLPNHYLDFNTASHYRFWPDRYIERMSLKKGIEETAKILKGLIKNAFNRYDLAFTITAGWDSRLMLSAAREISEQIYFFSLLRNNNERDAIVPAKLFFKLGLKHNVVNYPKRMSSQFAKFYQRNVTEAHDLWGRMAEGIFKYVPQGRVCVKGAGSETARVRFRLPDGEEVTARKLARFSSLSSRYGEQMENNPFVVKCWKRWLSELGDIYNINVLDLFYWEHWAGNFQAMALAEWDIVHEVFTPYNCRDLLTVMLSVDEVYRDHDETTLYRKVMEKLWPEVLSEPFNPVLKREISMRQRARKVKNRGKTLIKAIIG